MEMWRLWRPAEANARRIMFFAESKSGIKLTINAPEEDIEMYFNGQPEMYVYAEQLRDNLAIVGRALKEDWQNNG